MKRTYYIHTFGCQQNNADSERIASYCQSQGMIRTSTIDKADFIFINTCMVRESAENRVYGLVNNLKKLKEQKKSQGKGLSIIITGCMTGIAIRDPSGKLLNQLKKRMPAADQFLPIEEIGFSYEPVRRDKKVALIPITHGCNNFCSYCVVPFTRGREVSRPYADIVAEAQKAKDAGYTHVQLLGQNVNSYGSDLVLRQNYIANRKPVYVKHLGKHRIPTLFPHLLRDIALLGFHHVDFISSNPWDFSDELIRVIYDHKNITRSLHLAVQSGSNTVLKRMNRWYSAEEYLALIRRIKQKIPDIAFTTDIIVGFCGETDVDFRDTIRLCKKVQFKRAFISIYSQRNGTFASKQLADDVPHVVKEKRWKILDKLINTQFYT